MAYLGEGGRIEGGADVRKEAGRMPEKEGRKPVAGVMMDFARHSIKSKEKMADEKVPLAKEGILAAIAKKAFRPQEGRVTQKKSEEGEPVSVYGSPRERTHQSSLFRQFSELFKDATFEGVDPQDVIRWLEEGGALKVEGSPLLDFQMGEGKYEKQMLDEFGAGNLMGFMVERSDELAVKTKQNPDKATPLSIQAGNVAAFLKGIGLLKTKEALMNKGAAKDVRGMRIEEAFATSHQSVMESFLYKVIAMKDEDPEAAERFVHEDLGNKGFKENEGFKAAFLAYSEKPDDFEVLIEWKGKQYKLQPEDLQKIIREGVELKKTLKQLQKK